MDSTLVTSPDLPLFRWGRPRKPHHPITYTIHPLFCLRGVMLRHSEPLTVAINHCCVALSCKGVPSSSVLFFATLPIEYFRAALSFVRIVRRGSQHASSRCSACRRYLFNAAFLSCWTELDEEQQDDLVDCFAQALSASEVPPEVTHTLLNLAEFMEHTDKVRDVNVSINPDCHCRSDQIRP